MLQHIPLGCGVLAAEVADAIAFLAGEDAHFVTGVNLPVEGACRRLLASPG